MPKVSVCIASYNTALFLAEAIESVLAQSFDDFECIIVDDASTDGSLELARSYAKRDARVRIYANETNRGIAATRARMAELACGEYLAVLDSDDRCLPSRLAASVAYLETHPNCAAVGGQVIIINEDGNEIGFRPYPANAITRLASRSTLAHPASCIRRSAFDAVGGYMSGSNYAEDYALWVRLAAQGYTLANLDIPILALRLRHGQTKQSRVYDTIRATQTVHQLADSLGIVPSRSDRIYRWFLEKLLLLPSKLVYRIFLFLSHKPLPKAYCMPDLVWVLGPRSYRLSGVGQYSMPLITSLRAHGMRVRAVWNPFPARSLARFVWQFFWLPLMLLWWRVPHNRIIFYEEFYIPFLWVFRRANIIVHDVRDWSEHTSASLSLFERVCFSFITRSFGRLACASHVLVPTPLVQDLIAKRGLNTANVCVVPNAVDTALFCTNESTTENQELRFVQRGMLFAKYHIPAEWTHKTILLNVGTEETRKNVQTILEALTLVPNSVLIRIGKPIIAANRAAHEAYIAAHHLPVVFLQDVPTSDLVHFYTLADMLVAPSVFEGFGRTPIEAQAAGCPVIATHASALSWVLQNSAHILNNPTDPQELATAIEGIQNHPKIRSQWQEAGYQNAQRFDRETVFKNFVQAMHISFPT